MLKFISLIGLFTLTVLGFSQKPGLYINYLAEINNHHYFFIRNCPIDIHELTSPFIDKKSTLNSNSDYYFILYYELSLKNLVIIDSEKESQCILVNIYESKEFDQSIVMPTNYKAKKLRSKHLILDMVSAGSGNLIYRSWIDMNKMKAISEHKLHQRAICLLLKGLIIDPKPIE